MWQYTVRVGRENVTSQEMCDTFPMIQKLLGRCARQVEGPSLTAAAVVVLFPLVPTLLHSSRQSSEPIGKVYCIVASIREPGATVYHRVAVYSIATVLAMNSTAEKWRR